jgi:hypothetical protein
MDLFTRQDLKVLLTETTPPCVSLFMPAHRGGAEEDPIRFRNLLQMAEEQLLGHGLRLADAKELLGPARKLLDEPLFWANQCDGLALFLAPRFFRHYRLPLALAEQVVVSRLPQLRPLLPLLSGDGRFYVLALSQNGVRLLHGTRHTISAVDPRGVPKNLAEALRTHDRDEILTFHGPRAGAAWGAVFTGQGVGIDDAKDNLLRYFQKIDRGLHAILREEHSPLVVAGVGYLLPIFRQASTYPHLLETGIEGNPDHWSDQEMHERAWAIIGPFFAQEQASARALYDRLSGTGRTVADFAQVISAVYRGELETLFVSRTGQAWGTYEPGKQEVEQHAPAQPGDEELLNFAVVHALRHGGKVFILDEAAMPGGRLLAGIHWLPLPKHGKRPG